MADNGMSSLVISGDFSLLWAHDAAAAFGTQLYALDGFLKFAHAYTFSVTTRRKQRRFVNGIFNVGSHESRCGLRQDGHFDVRTQRLAPHMNAENRFATAHVRPVNYDAPIKPAGAHQRRI